MRFRSVLIALALAVLTAGAGAGIAVAQSSTDPGIAEPSPSGGVVPGEALGATSDADFWRAVREGRPATLSIPDREGAVLIQSEGENWRNIRNGPISTWGAWLLLGVVIAASLYFAMRGRIRISDGRSGRTIPRFTQWQRISHWFAAALFILLGFTGLVLLFGRYALKPLIGAEGFAALASASLQAHNLFGPLFLIAVVWLFTFFVKGNGYTLVDLKWLAKGGGFFGGHASSHFYNFGEKTWFWMSVLLGLALSVSGLVLDFPAFLEDRNAQQLAHLGHVIAALFFLAVGIGHIYLGAIGIEGAAEGMTSGEVDANWAKDHHDLWYEEAVQDDAARAGGE